MTQAAAPTGVSKSCAVFGDVGPELTIERYSGERRRAAYADLAREIGGHNPEVIVAHTNPIALALRAAAGAIPIVWIGVDGIRSRLATSLARPDSNITGVNLYDYEIWGKRLQILKEAVPSASKVAFLSRAGHRKVSTDNCLGR